MFCILFSTLHYTLHYNLQKYKKTNTKTIFFEKKFFSLNSFFIVNHRMLYISFKIAYFDLSNLLSNFIIVYINCIFVLLYIQ